MTTRRLILLVVLLFLAPAAVLGWGTLTGGLNMSAKENENLKWLIKDYGVDPAALGEQYEARTGSHPIHQFIVQQAWTLIAKDPAIADEKSGLPEVKAINAWDGIERCEQGMRERTPSTMTPITELAPPRPEGDDEARPGADAEVDRTGGWNPTYNGRAHYWNPWLEDGDAPRLAGENYERLAILAMNGGDPSKRAHHAAYLAHYVSDPVSAKHADMITLDNKTLDDLTKISKKWMEAKNDEIEDWLASPILTEAVTAIENRARAIGPQGDAWLDRVRSRAGVIGGTKLLKRGWWVVSWVDIADSSLRSAIGCYLHELEARPKVGGVEKPLDKFYSYFDPFYFNGPIFNPVGSYPDFSICVPLSEHLFWETNPGQYDLVKTTMSAPGEATTIVGSSDPKSIYLPWIRMPGFTSFDEKVAGQAMADTAADLVKRCALLSHGNIGDDGDFTPPFKDKLTLSVKCVATALRATVSALRGEGWARKTPDGRMRAQLVLENLADVPARLLEVQFWYKDRAGKRHSAPGWTVDLGGKVVTADEPLDLGVTIEGVPADLLVPELSVEVHADFGTLPDSGRLRLMLGTRETRRVTNPSGGAKLVRTKGPIDVIVVMDTTGSMQSSIDSMRDNAIAAIQKLRGQTKDIRMAVVTFRDRAVESDAGHFLTSGFTDDLESQFAFMRGLKADGGGDTPEDQLDGLSRAVALWENEPQDEDRVPAKVIVTITDAPAKVPDKAGNTFESIQARAFAVDPAHIYPIVVGSDTEAARHAAVLAAGTDGEVLSVKTGEEVANALLAAVDTAVVVHGTEDVPKAGGRTLLVVGIVLIVAAIAAGVVALLAQRRRRRLGVGAPQEVTP